MRVFETPGHTAGHICFHLPEDKILFAADTLFALGCGRLFERSAADMWHSFQKLAVLPDETAIYFGHEYTQSNARFALSVDAGNENLQRRARQIDELRAEGKFTIPTMMGLEKETNPFLRVADPDIRRHLVMEGATKRMCLPNCAAQGQLQVTAAEIIETLGMQRHPEGGWYVETFRDTAGAARGHSTAIYYLLEQGECSHWHRVKDAVEVWHFYAGSPLKLRLAKDGEKSARSHSRHGSLARRATTGDRRGR